MYARSRSTFELHRRIQTQKYETKLPKMLLPKSNSVKEITLLFGVLLESELFPILASNCLNGCEGF